jgi:hypothetical protein
MNATRSRRPRPGVALAALALTLGWGANVGAQRSWDTEGSAFLSWDFGGADEGHFGFGLEARRMYAQQSFSCGQGASTYAGFAARVTVYSFDQVRLLAAPQLGVTTSSGIPFPVESLGGELGLGYRLGRARGLYVQPGIELALGNLLFLRIDNSLGRDRETARFEHAAALDLGARLAPQGTQGCGVE